MASIHDGHRERMKATFAAHSEALTEVQFLELLLYYAVPRRDTNELAHRLLDRYGSLKEVLDADGADLHKVEGVGEGTELYLKVVREAVRRYVTEPIKETHYIFSSKDAGDYFIPLLQYERIEKVYLLCLNGRGGVICCTLIGSGTLNGVNLSIRAVVDEAVRRRSASVVLAHNHPDGFAIPSGEDRCFTIELKHALELMDIRLFDHIIVSDDSYVSFAQSGYLN